MKIAVIKGQFDNEGYYVPELHTVFINGKENKNMENSEIQEPIQMTIAKAEIEECLNQLADDDNQETIDELVEAISDYGLSAFELGVGVVRNALKEVGEDEE